MSNEHQRPYFDPSIFDAKRAERAESAARVSQLVKDIKQAFGFGKCKVIDNPISRKAWTEQQSKRT